jgi:hypothetical protein
MAKSIAPSSTKPKWLLPPKTEKPRIDRGFFLCTTVPSRNAGLLSFCLSWRFCSDAKAVVSPSPCSLRADKPLRLDP